MLSLLDSYKAENKRVLVFSQVSGSALNFAESLTHLPLQFVQILNILEAIFNHKGIKYLVLTGSTAVDERQGLVDEFNEDENISVFLLSTRAGLFSCLSLRFQNIEPFLPPGGMGINLTAACVVIIFDQDFNPHNDKQACDRAYRIGQTRDVEIVKLITRGTIEVSIG